MIEVTLFNDPGCPWGYSASPALRVLEWRYPELRWRLVVIGLTDEARQYEERGYTPGMMAEGHLMFRARYGMPFIPHVKSGVSATGRACRAIVAARQINPEDDVRVMRALQLANFTQPIRLDDDAALRAVLAAVPGLDADAIVEALDTPAVTEAYERDKAEARTAAGSPTEFQGKAAATDGPVRFTAPSLRFHAADGRTLEAGGFQPVEAYDVLLANLSVSQVRRDPPAEVSELFEVFPEGLTTQEVAALLAEGNTPPDRAAAERALLAEVAVGALAAFPVGDDNFWTAAGTEPLRAPEAAWSPAGVGRQEG